MWNNKRYSGDLKNYHYPVDKEFGSLLSFLKQVNVDKKIHLTDVMDWQMPYPESGYDLYIVCAFGEFVNEEFMNKIDSEMQNIVLLTSQYFDNHNYKNTKVFYLEHLHTIKRFFTKTPYPLLSERSITHGSLSNRSTLHKTIITVKLLNRFKEDYRYTFCNQETTEYTIDSLDFCLAQFYPFLNLTDDEFAMIKNLHNNPVKIEGNTWGIENKIYRDCKVIWTTESIFLSNIHAPTAYLTEKIIKSIISGSAFVLIGQQNSLARLNALGFKHMFDFDVNFDSKFDDKRFEEIFKLIDNFVFSDVQDIVDYNYNYFWGEFYDNTERMNQPLIQSILEYIND